MTNEKWQMIYDQCFLLYPLSFIIAPELNVSALQSNK